MRVELKLMQRKLGTTMIYVTHDQLEALSMADRVAVMHDGVLQQFGPPQEVYYKPANQWVAGFVGEPPMNFLDCELVEEGDILSVRHPNFTTALLPEQAAILRESGDSRSVTLGVRPEEVAIHHSAGEGAFSGNVMLTEPLGGDLLVDVALKDSKVLVKAKPSYQGSQGDTCHLTFDRTRWHLFSNENGVAHF